MIYTTKGVEFPGFLKKFHFCICWVRIGVLMVGAKKMAEKKSESSNKLLCAAMVAVMVALLAINTKTSWNSFLGLNPCKQVCIFLSFSHVQFLAFFKLTFCSN